MIGEKGKGPSRISIWSNLHSQDGSMAYFSSKNRSMHCRGEAAGENSEAENESGKESVLKPRAVGVQTVSYAKNGPK